MIRTIAELTKKVEEDGGSASILEANYDKYKESCKDICKYGNDAHSNLIGMFSGMYVVGYITADEYSEIIESLYI